MGDSVEAGFDVAFQDPHRCVSFGEHVEALRDGIRHRPLLAKAVGVGIGGRFDDRIQGEEVECLVRPVDHGGNAEMSELAVLLGDRDAAERLGMVAAAAKAGNGGSFAGGGVPSLSIYSRCSFARRFCHSSHRQGFGAERAGQQALQGFDLAPSAFLDCLHDTRLEPTNHAIDLAPGDGVPVGRAVGDCTSRTSCRHLLCLLCRLVKLSRAG